MRRGLAHAAMFWSLTGNFAVGCLPNGGRCSLHAETRCHPAWLRKCVFSPEQKNALRRLFLRLLRCRKRRLKTRHAREMLLRTRRCNVDGHEPRLATLLLNEDSKTGHIWPCSLTVLRMTPAPTSAVLAVAPAAGFSGAAIWGAAPLPSTRVSGLIKLSRRGVCPPVGLGLRASLNDPVEGGADGSMEKLLGNVGLGKFGKGIDWFFDTSTISGAKAWRLQEISGEADSRRWRKGDELEEQLQDQISSRTLQRDEVAAMVQDGDYYSDSPLEKEYSLDDADLSSALTARLQQLSYQEGDMGDQLTGAELALLCYKKYGLYHDMALKCDMLQLVSDKKLVSINIYYAYFGQLNPRFQYSEAEYLQKCDLIATAVNQWNQAPYVREFFAEPPRAYRGLPSRPRWDTAVSIRLYKSPTWSGANVDEWFLT